MTKIRSTTVIAVKHNGQVAIGADGQATMGNTVVKTQVKKLRKLMDGKIMVNPDFLLRKSLCRLCQRFS